MLAGRHAVSQSKKATQIRFRAQVNESWKQEKQRDAVQRHMATTPRRIRLGSESFGQEWPVQGRDFVLSQSRAIISLSRFEDKVILRGSVVIPETGQVLSLQQNFWQYERKILV